MTDHDDNSNINQAAKQQQRRQQRKEEGKRLKRQRIDESGGHRPRPSSTTAVNDIGPSPKSRKRSPGTASSSKPNNSIHKNNHHQNHQQHHRFGRVMDQVPCRNQPRYHTLSIAVPGSIVSNCQTKELKTLLVGQIARAATIYHVDEIIVFDDQLSSSSSSHHSTMNQSNTATAFGRRRNQQQHEHGGDEKSKADGGTEIDNDNNDESQPHSRATGRFNPHVFMARLLQYCECPQYLRRSFFPMHPDLQYTGLLPPLDAPHHVRATDACPYREGVVVYDKVGPHQGMSLVNCGIPGRLVEIDRILTNGIRCTVKIDRDAYHHQKQKQQPNVGGGGKKEQVMQGIVVSPAAPREDNGTYWGYTTRLADHLRAIFDECPYEGGYDLKIGTSERGTSVDELLAAAATTTTTGVVAKAATAARGFQHALIVFGGVAGIEECVDADEGMKLPGSSASTLFDLWLNTCPFQGSRTIRTEEAILISLARLSPFLEVAAGASRDSSSNPKDNKTPQRSSSSRSSKTSSYESDKVLPDIVFTDEVSSEEDEC